MIFCAADDEQHGACTVPSASVAGRRLVRHTVSAQNCARGRKSSSWCAPSSSDRLRSAGDAFRVLPHTARLSNWRQRKIVRKTGPQSKIEVGQLATCSSECAPSNDTETSESQKIAKIGSDSPPGLSLRRPSVWSHMPGQPVHARQSFRTDAGARERHVGGLCAALRALQRRLPD